jgi:hypothetical protein
LNSTGAAGGKLGGSKTETQSCISTEKVENERTYNTTAED